MSNTPRTDAESFAADDACYDVVQADFARDLERENAALRAEVEADHELQNAFEDAVTRAERAEAELAAIKAAQPQQGEPVAFLLTGGVFGGEIEEHDLDQNDKECERLNRLANGNKTSIALYAQPDGWVSEQDAKIKRMAEALRDVWSNDYISYRHNLKINHADALRDAGVKP
jgi:hypothetical protein